MVLEKEIADDESYRLAVPDVRSWPPCRTEDPVERKRLLKQSVTLYHHPVSDRYLEYSPWLTFNVDWLTLQERRDGALIVPPPIWIKPFHLAPVMAPPLSMTALAGGGVLAAIVLLGRGLAIARQIRKRRLVAWPPRPTESVYRERPAPESSAVEQELSKLTQRQILYLAEACTVVACTTAPLWGAAFSGFLGW